MKKIKNLLQNITQPVKLFFMKLFRASIAVDYNSMMHVVLGGVKLNPEEILDIYYKFNLLIYRGTNVKGDKHQPPIILNRGLLSLKPIFIDWNKLTEEEKKKIMDKIEKS